MVEFYRAPQNKDVSGRRSPATVVSFDRKDEGIVEVRWQSRVLQVRMPDLRRALVYLTLLASVLRLDYPDQSPWRFVVSIVESLNQAVSVLYGFEIGNDGRWRLTPNTERRPKDFHGLLFVAACNFHLRRGGSARREWNSHYTSRSRLHPLSDHLVDRAR